MPGYLIADVVVENPEEYQEYRRRVMPTVEEFGGRFLVRGGTPEVHEHGDWQPRRLVVIEFPSLEQARQWYHSPGYQEIIPIRQRASNTGFMALVEGI